MSMVVDFPAPFGPSRATVSPGAIVMSTPRTACTTPCPVWNDFVRPASATPVGPVRVFVAMETTMPWTRSMRSVPARHRFAMTFVRAPGIGGRVKRPHARPVCTILW